jgi:hypothetical protein
VFVALALIGGTPKKRSAGKVMKLPPPAIELRMPPKKPAVKSDSNLNSIFFKIPQISSNPNIEG